MPHTLAALSPRKRILVLHEVSMQITGKVNLYVYWEDNIFSRTKLFSATLQCDAEIKIFHLRLSTKFEKMLS
jgi:hypothetical protein